jgi:DNA-binding NarL/FixJ family response regulator
MIIIAKGVSMSHMIRVLVANELPMVREGLRSVLNHAAHIEWVAEATHKAEAWHLCQQYQPDVLLFSLDLPDFSPPLFTEQIQPFTSQTKVILIVNEGADVIKLPFVPAGVSGCLLQSDTGTVILQAIQQVYKGVLWFSQPILQKLLEPAQNKLALSQPQGMTERETEVLTLLARGWSNQQIATALFIAERTVKFHVGNIYHKLNVPSRPLAINWAWQHGFGISD